METITETAVAELNRKIDMLTLQVAYLAEQAQEAERSRRERDELLHDLMPIANDAFRMSVEQLEEIQEYVDLADLIRLLKRILRNGRNIERMLDMLESGMDLAQTLGPLGNEAFAKAVDTLEAMEQKGYFKFARGGMKIVDNIVTSFTEEEVQQLGDNIVLILRTVKDMTQPEVMNFVRNTVNVAEEEVEVDTSYRSLIGQMRDPNVRRGLAQAMRVLSSIGAQPKN